ncbi:MAG: hypothetical protein M0T79_04745 [Actinomycetota bacterium]|nr:hypothetical protein [Actinomycetota bacterium]
MKRSELEHIIRAAGSILGEDTVIIVGSQAILASRPEEELPPAAMRSLEGDVLPLDDRDGVKADLIDGALGELSLFDSTHGIHADGVSASTSILPALWRDRLIAYSNPNTNGVTALCLERHDLCVAKLVANRDKDREFVRALIGKDIVDVDIIISRLALTDISDELRDQITARVRAYGQAQCGP